MDAIRENDKVIVPAKYVIAVNWLRTQVDLNFDNFPSLMFKLGSFFNEINNLEPQIVRYEEDKNEN